VTVKRHNAVWYANQVVLCLNGKSYGPGIGDGGIRQGDFLYARLAIVTKSLSAVVWTQFLMEGFKV